MGILGPNGAGKTTLLGILSTALSGHTGNILVRGSTLRTKGSLDEFRSELGVVPQRLETMGGLTCREFVRYVGWLRAIPAVEAEERVASALSAVGLDAQIDQRVGTLSGGMRQRLSLAQAIVNRPSLLLLDEPTVSLDPAQRDQFLNLLTQLSPTTTVLMTSHVAEDVAAFAEEVVVIHGGQARYVGSLNEFCDLPATAQVQGSDVKNAYLTLLRDDPSTAS